MKTKIAFVVLLSAVYVLAMPSGDWTKYSSPEGRYSILFPTEPQLSNQETPAASGEKVKQYMALSSGSGATCVVAYFGIAPGSTFSFDKGRDGMVAAVKGTLLEEKPLTLSGYPGRELKIAAQSPSGEEFISLVRYYQAGDRVYIVQFLFLKSSESELVGRRTKYFDSFQIAQAR